MFSYTDKRQNVIDMFPHMARINDILSIHSCHVEMIVLLSKEEIDSKKVRVEFSLEDMDTSGFQQGAAYGQIADCQPKQIPVPYSADSPRHN